MLLKTGIILVFGLITYIKAFDECKNQPWIFPNIKSGCPEGEGHCRVRKEFTHMTLQERCRYVEAVIRVSTEAPFKTVYKNLLCIHRKHFHEIHGGHPKTFLPFHRWLMLQYENLLRRVDCTVTVSYWDWSTNPTNPFESEVWGAYCALGGNGNEKNDYIVETGPFRSFAWHMSPDTNFFFLRRNFDRNAILTDFKPTYLLESLLTPTFYAFSGNLEYSSHSTFHNIIRGTMIGKLSGWAPEFFFHHGFIDKLWDDWQSWCRNHAADVMRFFKHHDTKLVGTVGMNSSSVLDLLNQPGNICVKYKTYGDLPLSKLQAAADRNCTGSAKISEDVTVSRLSKKDANCKRDQKDESVRKRA